VLGAAVIEESEVVDAGGGRRAAHPDENRECEDDGGSKELATHAMARRLRDDSTAAGRPGYRGAVEAARLYEVIWRRIVAESK
jgi:hypothetical protein